ncbi:hypothetical protein BJX76DRAFT_216174 [Aspergillus varians]
MQASFAPFAVPTSHSAARSLACILPSPLRLELTNESSRSRHFSITSDHQLAGRRETIAWLLCCCLQTPLLVQTRSFCWSCPSVTDPSHVNVVSPVQASDFIIPFPACAYVAVVPRYAIGISCCRF